MGLCPRLLLALVGEEEFGGQAGLKRCNGVADSPAALEPLLRFKEDNLLGMVSLIAAYLFGPVSSRCRVRKRERREQTVCAGSGRRSARVWSCAHLRFGQELGQLSR
jgi:hypothetical protein